MTISEDRELEQLYAQKQQQYAHVYTLEELQETFVVNKHTYGDAYVTTKADNQQSVLSYTHYPRVYYNMRSTLI